MDFDYSKLDTVGLSLLAQNLREKADEVEAAVKKRIQDEVQFPEAFYFYGEDESTDRLTAAGVNELITEQLAKEKDNPLYLGEIVVNQEGDTLIVRFREGKVIKTFVAQGYAEHVAPVPDRKPIVSWFNTDEPMQVWGLGPQFHPNT